jgi:hypothetical protein
VPPAEATGTLTRDRITRDLRELGGSARERLRSGWRGVRDVATDSADTTFDWMREQTGKFAERAQELPELASRMVFTDCVVPTFLLPTGAGSRDFVCAFEFSAVLDQLQSGVLVRPRVVAWSGRSDVDRAQLASVLREDFAVQFRAQRDAADVVSDVQAARLAALEASTEKTGARTRSAAKTAAAGVGAMLLFANPIADLAFLALALYGGTSAVQGLWRHFQVSGDLRRHELDMERQRKQLETELDRGDQRFRSAVQRIEVRHHPTLHDIVAQMCELEGVAFMDADQAVPPGEQVPNVIAQLSAPGYRQKVPEWFHPLIDIQSDPKVS